MAWTHRGVWPLYRGMGSVRRVHGAHFLGECNRVCRKRTACFLTLIGSSAYKLLGSLIVLDKPGDKTYNDLVAVMKQHYCPKTAVVVQWFKFNSRKRQTGESITVYVAEVRRLANCCNYRAALNNMLSDCPVVGINDDHIQLRLLAEGDLLFEKALAMVLGIEAAVENAWVIWSVSIVSEEGTTVNWLSMKKVSAENTACYRCGVMGHTPAKCKFKEGRCYNCDKIGHIAKVCRSKSQKQLERSWKQITTVSSEMLHDASNLCKWTEVKERAFQASKQLLLMSDVLVHYDPKLELVLLCDASSYGVGTVLSHHMPDGTERLVRFASRTLMPAEKKYSQIEKEGLACILE